MVLFGIQPSIDVRFSLKFAITSYLSMLNFNMIQAYVYAEEKKKPSVTLIVKKKKDSRDVAGKYCLSVALNNS